MKHMKLFESWGNLDGKSPSADESKLINLLDELSRKGILDKVTKKLGESPNFVNNFRFVKIDNGMWSHI